MKFQVGDHVCSRFGPFVIERIDGATYGERLGRGGWHFHLEENLWPEDVASYKVTTQMLGGLFRCDLFYRASNEDQAAALALAANPGCEVVEVAYCEPLRANSQG
jgi:hypothetical protein